MWASDEGWAAVHVQYGHLCNMATHAIWPSVQYGRCGQVTKGGLRLMRQLREVKNTIASNDTKGLKCGAEVPCASAR